jgi:hypothetical protein
MGSSEEMPFNREERPRLCNFCLQPVHGSLHILVMLPPNSDARFEYYHIRFRGDCWDQQQSKEKPNQPAFHRAAA